MVLERYDLSDYLIHFVRSINLSGDDLHMSEMFPKEFGFDEELGGDVISPFFYT
ncbi:hypothetical protein [Halanaerobium praevalens]|uniref:hypothetical protein n=1 Tax=Halanaerobium praevalens TaxID=2331 RepID=UPI0002F588B3|nr:hypothetical protein [Halanaerobium praevalens]